MNLNILPYPLAVLHFSPNDPIPDFVWSSPFYSITRSDSELSVFLAADAIPASVEASTGWRAMRVAGHIDFQITGIISSLTMPLAAKQISVFSISTYETDYLVVPEDRLDDATDVLRRAGHHFV